MISNTPLFPVMTADFMKVIKDLPCVLGNQPVQVDVCWIEKISPVQAPAISGGCYIPCPQWYSGGIKNISKPVPDRTRRSLSLRQKFPRPPCSATLPAAPSGKTLSCNSPSRWVFHAFHGLLEQLLLSFRLLSEPLCAQGVIFRPGKSIHSSATPSSSSKE